MDVRRAAGYRRRIIVLAVYAGVFGAAAALAGLSSLTGAASFGSLQVAALYPGPNGHTTALYGPVSVTLNMPPAIPPQPDHTLAVFRPSTGLISGTYAAAGNRLFLEPQGPFQPGELVEAVLTTATQSITGTALAAPVVWKFRVGARRASGVFTGSGQLIGTGSTYDIGLADLDGDQDLDALIANFDQDTEIWLNTGEGQYYVSAQTFGLTQTLDLELADIDRDGDPDVVFSGASGASIWLNDGYGGFTDSGQMPGAAGTLSVALGDIDGDADLDLFLGLGDFLTGLPNEVWFNDGAGHFSSSGQRLGAANTLAVALADLDGDGDLDAIAANGLPIDPQPDSVWLNNGSGYFTSTGQPLNPGATWSFELGDLDEDGDLDLLAGNVTTTTDVRNRVWWNLGAAVFDPGPFVGSNRSDALALGDIDGDGDLDAFITYDGLPDEVWRNDGSGNFTNTGQLLGMGCAYALAIGDLDDDGDVDAFVGNEAANEVWLNQNSPWQHFPLLRH